MTTSNSSSLQRPTSQSLFSHTSSVFRNNTSSKSKAEEVERHRKSENLDKLVNKYHLREETFGGDDADYISTDTFTTMTLLARQSLRYNMLLSITGVYVCLGMPWVLAFPMASQSPR